MADITASFLYIAVSVRQACLYFQVSEDEIDFRTAESQFSGSLIALPADSTVPTIYLIVQLGDGSAAVYMGVPAHPTISHEYVCYDRQVGLPHGGANRTFGCYPKMEGRS